MYVCKSLNDNIKNWVCFGQILSCSDGKHFQVNCTLNTHARTHARTHDGSQICYFNLCWLTYRFSRENFFLTRNPVDSTRGTHRKEVPSLSLHNIDKWIICTGHERLLELIESWLRNIHTLLQSEVSNYHSKLQPGSQCHVCTDNLFATILS